MYGEPLSLGHEPLEAGLLGPPRGAATTSPAARARERQRRRSRPSSSFSSSSRRASRGSPRRSRPSSQRRSNAAKPMRACLLVARQPRLQAPETTACPARPPRTPRRRRRTRARAAWRRPRRWAGSARSSRGPCACRGAPRRRPCRPAGDSRRTSPRRATPPGSATDVAAVRQHRLAHQRRCSAWALVPCSDAPTRRGPRVACRPLTTDSGPLRHDVVGRVGMARPWP